MGVENIPPISIVKGKLNGEAVILKFNSVHYRYRDLAKRINDGLGVSLVYLYNNFEWKEFPGVRG